MPKAACSKVLVSLLHATPPTGTSQQCIDALSANRLTSIGLKHATAGRLGGRSSPANVRTAAARASGEDGRRRAGQRSRSRKSKPRTTRLRGSNQVWTASYATTRRARRNSIPVCSILGDPSATNTRSRRRCERDTGARMRGPEAHSKPTRAERVLASDQESLSKPIASCAGRRRPVRAGTALLNCHPASPVAHSVRWTSAQVPVRRHSPIPLAHEI